LRPLTWWGDANKKPHVPTTEECHLRRSSEQKRQTKYVSIEGDARFKIIYRDQQLPDFRIRKVHFNLRRVSVDFRGA